MKELQLPEISPNEKKRIGYIEERPDLFETKTLSIKSNNPEGKNLLIAARDPGSANVLLPVVNELRKEMEIGITAITDGKAKEIIEKNFDTEDITTGDMALGSDRAIGTPDAILMDVSTEMGLDTYLAATFADSKKVLIEDYYGTAIRFLSAAKERKLAMPEKICVMDEGAKELIIESMPELEDRIEITGQPIFDRFAHEDTEAIAEEVKGRLGLRPDEKIVSYMSTFDEPKKIQRAAEALKQIPGDFHFVFRRHPRDNNSYEIFKAILTNAGVKAIDTDSFSTDEIGAASDVVLTTWSTEGLCGIYRRKPTAHIIDPDFRISKGLHLPLIPVKLGASVGIDKVDQLKDVLPELLDKGSDLNSSLLSNMEKYYQADGNNAKRIADIIQTMIK